MQDVPSAVSFKELSSFLKAAGKPTPAEKGSGKMSVSYDWVERTSALLKEIEQSSSAAAEGKTEGCGQCKGAWRVSYVCAFSFLFQGPP